MFKMEILHIFVVLTFANVHAALNFRPRVLLTDQMFPVMVQAWRVNEIQGMIEAFDTDILVMERVNSYYGSNFTFIWSNLLQSHHIDQYDILIFNEQSIQYDKYNAVYTASGEKPFDGKQFLGKVPRVDYMLRLKKYRNETLNISADYEAYYHIFSVNYHRFLGRFPKVPGYKHILHLYPAGGFNPNDNSSKYKFHPEMTIISSIFFVTEFVTTHFPSIRIFEVHAGPLLSKWENIIERPNYGSSHKFVACFTSVGSFALKGGDVYYSIANEYSRMYPKDNIQFIAVGNNPYNSNVTLYPVMAQEKLDRLYETKVDAIFNLERSNRLNGWPLGAEAILRGALLFSTDNYDFNNRTGFNLTDGFVIVNPRDFKNTIASLRQYVKNSTLLYLHRKAIQSKIYNIMRYENVMRRIEDIVRGVVLRGRKSENPKQIYDLKT